MQKSWMWPNNNGGVHGVIIDLEEGKIQWFDEPGCACGGSDSEQNFADFMTNGPRFLIPPDDIISEMLITLTQVG